MTTSSSMAGDPPTNPPGVWPFIVPSPRTMTVTLPFSERGVTVAVMDQDGNLSIKVNQPAL